MSSWVLPSGGTLGIPSHICKAPFPTELLGQAPCQLSPRQGNKLGILGSDWTHWTGTKTWEHNPGMLSHPLSCFLPGTGTPCSPRDKTESSCGRNHPVGFATASHAVCLRDAVPAGRKMSRFTAEHIIYTEQRHWSVSSHHPQPLLVPAAASVSLAQQCRPLKISPQLIPTWAQRRGKELVLGRETAAETEGTGCGTRGTGWVWRRRITIKGWGLPGSQNWSGHLHFYSLCTEQPAAEQRAVHFHTKSAFFIKKHPSGCMHGNMVTVPSDKSDKKQP